MKPISSVITTSPEAPSANAGLQAGAHGLETPPNGRLSASSDLVPINQEEFPKLERLLTGLLPKWRDTAISENLKHGLTEPQLTACIAMLRRAEVPSTPVATAQVLKTMLEPYLPLGREVPDTLVTTWLGVMDGQPFASILSCAKRQVRSADEWAPKPGQFLQKVEAHAGMISRLRRKLEDSA